METVSCKENNLSQSCDPEVLKRSLKEKRKSRKVQRTVRSAQGKDEMTHILVNRCVAC